MSKTAKELNAENKVVVEIPPKDTVEKVWIGCRATAECPGTYAEIILQREQPSTNMMSAFNISLGGRFVRYRCCTCHKIFSISS